MAQPTTRKAAIVGGNRIPFARSNTAYEVAVGALERTAATWRVPHDAGRRHATASGEVNPIHLSGLTVKALGFKRAIAHGRWVETAEVVGGWDAAVRNAGSGTEHLVATIPTLEVQH